MHGPGLCQKMKSTVLKLVKVASHVHSILHLLSEIQATWPSGLPTRLGQGLAALLSHIDLKHQSLPISSSRQGESKVKRCVREAMEKEKRGGGVTGGNLEHFLQSTFSEQNPGARRGEVWPCEGKGLRWCHSGDKAWGTPAQGTRENGGAMLLRSSHLPEVRSSSGSKCILPEILASEMRLFTYRPFAFLEALQLGWEKEEKVCYNGEY
ncbi:uncharacterized protein LOC141509824 isoform X2 [Macrotis lagotis]|uniref:uncharacterized protein LOC141509824 isoform X2 n=1 Tax=Macrotis lagotis TaxID=92651 RepID=UPI003D691FD6